MKKFILAAALLAPLAVAAPAFAQGGGDAAGFIETPSITTYAPNQPREFSSQRSLGGQTVGVSNAERNLIQREVVPSSAFSSSN
ncbi:hypothetical protein [Phreatobacter stygius]|uniref:DUF4148 domain-containing protein n=1 Tax=Phreatobacter stygius TaxID=1940610 RepID=A0A4D7BBM8_9HYPH|nr:hypothetical protein [Phreatobacter stygius]QCI68130.1 hypothetical protein E8M01_30200 [Phreatobacter stygius]